MLWGGHRCSWRKPTLLRGPQWSWPCMIAAFCACLCDRRRPRFCRNMSRAQNVFWFAIASCDAWFDRMPKRWKPWNACRRSTVLIGRKVQSSDMREEWKSAFALWNCVFDGVCCIRICLWIHACQMYIKSIYIYISWACWFGIIFRLFNQLPKFIYN